MDIYQNYDVIGIDEAQFFDDVTKIFFFKLRLLYKKFKRLLNKLISWQIKEK